jgi:L-ascorbate metabolism protein UlaG (beta-lactamase superfamily)
MHKVTKKYMQLTYLGHSCFLLETAGKKLIFDPFIRNNELAKDKVSFEELEADYILISHGHEDHTADLIDLAKQTGATVVCSWEIHAWLNQKGITKTHPMNIGGKWQFDFGTVHMVFAAHSSSLPDGSYAGVAAGFIIESNGKKIYYAGDTALTSDMQLIPTKHKLDYALLPIGDNFTMDYKDACTAARMIQCKQIIAMHFDTFGFIQVNHEEALAHFKQHEIALTIPQITQTIQL